MWSIRSGFSLPYILAQMFYTYYGTIAHNHILALAIPIIAISNIKLIDHAANQSMHTCDDCTVRYCSLKLLLCKYV